MNLSLKTLCWKNTFVTQLPADPILENYSRIVKNCLFSFVNNKLPNSLETILFSAEIANKLNLNISKFNGKELKELQEYLTNERNIQAYAACYGGHQFGNWAGQLGDGRALTFAEIETSDGQSFDFQLKGSGTTPYSRIFDGKATLESSIREFIGSESLRRLGIPTTNIMAVMSTGENILRNEGNEFEKHQRGAISIRVSPSLIRFGSFELPFYERNSRVLNELIQHTIKNNFKENPIEDVLGFFKKVVDRTALLVAKWQSIGFVHGVLNTDNMSIIGETIDFGPFGFMEEYREDWTPNLTDRGMKRYAYGRQPDICPWNLTKLAKTLTESVDNVSDLKTILDSFMVTYEDHFYQIIGQKLGIGRIPVNQLKDLVDCLIDALKTSKVDFTLFFREFGKVCQIDLLNLSDFFARIENSFYDFPSSIKNSQKWQTFLDKFNSLCWVFNIEFSENRKIEMEKINPKFVPRNWILKRVTDECEKGNYELLEKVYAMVKAPYTENVAFDEFYSKQPGWTIENNKGCQLSCSS